MKIKTTEIYSYFDNDLQKVVSINSGEILDESNKYYNDIFQNRKPEILIEKVEEVLNTDKTEQLELIEEVSEVLNIDKKDTKKSNKKK